MPLCCLLLSPATPSLHFLTHAALRFFVASARLLCFQSWPLLKCFFSSLLLALEQECCASQKLLTQLCCACLRNAQCLMRSQGAHELLQCSRASPHHLRNNKKLPSLLPAWAKASPAGAPFGRLSYNATRRCCSFMGQRMKISRAANVKSSQARSCSHGAFGIIVRGCMLKAPADNHP